MKMNKINNDVNLQPARDAKGKRIDNALVRPPQSKDDSKFPSQLGAVFHARERRRERCLWYRLPRGPFVAQFGSNPTVRFDLDAETLRQAIDELQELKIMHRGGDLATPRRMPSFSTFANEYMEVSKSEQFKKHATIESECYKIRWWCNYLNDTPLDKLTLAQIKGGFMSLKTKGPKGRPLKGRTLNYYLTGINSVLNEAVDQQLIKINPTKLHSGRKNRLWRKLPKSSRPLFTEPEKDALCAAAIEHCPRNGQQLADLINLLCFCGSRVGVALRLRWADVDWDNRLLTLARDGNSKSNSSRTIQFMMPAGALGEVTWWGC